MNQILWATSGDYVHEKYRPNHLSAIPAFANLSMDSEFNVVEVEENKEVIDKTKQAGTLTLFGYMTLPDIFSENLHSQLFQSIFNLTRTGLQYNAAGCCSRILFTE